MERITATTLTLEKLKWDPSGGYLLASCSIHDNSFAVDHQGHCFGLQTKDLCIPEAVISIVNNCQHDSDHCRFYILTASHDLYQWEVELSSEAPKKRIRLTHEETMDIDMNGLSKISSHIIHVMAYMPNQLILFSETEGVRLWQTDTHHFQKTNVFTLQDTQIKSSTNVKTLNCAFVDFFKLAHHQGIFLAKQDGSVYWRSLQNDSKLEETWLLSMEPQEQILWIEYDSDQLVVIGNQGTVVSYFSRHDTGLHHQTFRIHGTIRALSKMSASAYWVANGLGKLSRLDIEQAQIKNTPTRGISNVLLLASSLHSTLKAVLVDRTRNEASLVQVEYDPTLVSIKDDPNALEESIMETLDELAQSESLVKQMDAKEQALNQKLTSINRTLYAIQTICDKRKIGECNSIESTGFEYTIQPLVQSNSSEQGLIHTTSHLRICIKTSRFLELEDWLVQLHFSSSGLVKRIPLVGLEPYFENHIERYLVWEQDIQVNTAELPCQVESLLLMDLNPDPAVCFPLSTISLDDLHFAVPLNEGLNSSIQKRGLKEVSNRLMKSWQHKRQRDNTPANAFARWLRKQQKSNETQEKNFELNTVHQRYSIDASLTDEGYRSILSLILGEGRTANDIKCMLYDGAEHASFVLTSYPGCPILLDLSKVSDTMIEFRIQCYHIPALFKTEAILLQRMEHFCLENMDKPVELRKEIEGFRSSLSQLQETDQAVFDHSVQRSVQQFYRLYSDIPIGHFKIEH